MLTKFSFLQCWILFVKIIKTVTRSNTELIWPELCQNTVILVLCTLHCDIGFISLLWLTMFTCKIYLHVTCKNV